MNRSNVFFLSIGIASLSSCAPLDNDTSKDLTLKSSIGGRIGQGPVNRYLYSWPTRIEEGGRMTDHCWYYKEVPQNSKKVLLVDALRTAVPLQRYSLSDVHLRNKFNQALAGWGANAALSQGLSTTCQAAAVKMIPLATAGILSGGVGTAAAAGAFIALCAWGIYETVETAQGIRRNTHAHKNLGGSSIAGPIYSIPPDVLGRIKEAVLQSGDFLNFASEHECPSSQLIIQFLLKEGVKFPGYG